MIKAIFFLTIFFFAINDFLAQDSVGKSDPDLCQELADMMVQDQKYRKLPGLSGITFFTVLDSLKKVNNISQKEYTNLSEEEQLEWGKKAREITNKLPKYTKKEKDSIWQLQNKIDDINIKRVIEIVKQNGWVTMENLECDKYFATWVFFRHAPKKYFATIRELIDKEKEENRLSSSEYMMIDNHLKGRPFPEMNYVD